MSLWELPEREVSKDAAAMILTDDNFATIIKAVANGRNVYRNIKNCGSVPAVRKLSAGILGGTCIHLLQRFRYRLQPVHLSVYQSADRLSAGHCHWYGKGRKRSAVRAATGSETGNTDERPDDSPFRTGRPDCSLYHDRFLYRFVHGQCNSQFYGVCHTDFGKTVPWIQLQKQTFRAFKIGLASNIYSVGAFFGGVLLLALVIFVPVMRTLYSVSPLSGYQIGMIALLAFTPTVIIQLYKVMKEHVHA